MPDDEIVYLSLQDVVDLHDDVLRRMGSPRSPLIHGDRLDSAICRARNVAYDEGADLAGQAAILAVGISQSQAFLDGNKRAAFAAADVFLRLNGFALGGHPLDIARRLESVAETLDNRSRDEEIDKFATYIRENLDSIR